MSYRNIQEAVADLYDAPAPGSYCAVPTLAPYYAAPTTVDPYTQHIPWNKFFFTAE